MRRSKYKIGQKVTVRPDIKDFTNISPMVFYAGKTVTISHCSWSTVLKGYVYNTEETGMYIWKEGWLLPPLCYEKIVITSDGVTTTAKKYDGKKLIKEAKAVCSKDDVFNFEVGANLAMERLMAEEKPKLYNGRVVCVDTSCTQLYTKGKIYQFKNGIACDNTGSRFSCCLHKPIASFDEIQGCATWLEVVE